MHNSRQTRKYPLFIPKPHRQQQQHLTHRQQALNSDWESSLSSQTMQAITSARANYLPTPHSPLLREYDSQDNRQHKSHSLSLGQDSSQFDHLANDFLTEIQLLDYAGAELQEDFKEIVKGHIMFEGNEGNEGIEPVAESQLGHRLISDGLFHEMWGKVVKQTGAAMQTWVYYQKYLPLVRTNCSNFETAFNHETSAEEQHKAGVEEMMQESTNLRPIRAREGEGARKAEQAKGDLQLACKENDEPIENKGVEWDDSGRLRLFGQIQSNQRRLNAEVVCHFLRIRTVYKLEDVDIATILESSFSDGQELVVMEAHVPCFSLEVLKKVVNYRPMVLLVLYGEVSLRQLLRLRASYDQLEGLVVYDQTLQLRAWLREKGHLSDPSMTAGLS